MGQYSIDPFSFFIPFHFCIVRTDGYCHSEHLTIRRTNRILTGAEGRGEIH